jgi:hypothetical protein
VLQTKVGDVARMLARAEHEKDEAFRQLSALRMAAHEHSVVSS